MNKKPCPFCGETRNLSVRKALSSRWHRYVECNSCNATGPIVVEDRPAQYSFAHEVAIDQETETQWNERGEA